MVRASTEAARQLAYPMILQQLAEGVIVTDAVGTIIFVNDAAAAIHGVARLDIRPNAYADTYHLYREDGRPYPSDELPLARAVRGETVNDARWRIKRPDGGEVLAIGSARPLRDVHGRRTGALLTIRDATEQDNAERSLRKSQAALRDVEARLKAHGTTTGNADAGADGDRRASLKDTSRRIKTPLQEILAHANWILQTSSLDDIKMHGELVRATSGALLSLVDKLLGLVDAEGSEIARTPQDLPPLSKVGARVRG